MKFNLVLGCLLCLMSLKNGYAATSLQVQQYQTIGQGVFTFWLWDLYEARLANPSGHFVSYAESAPLLLELRYLRNITKKEFIDATVDQWKEQQGTVTQQHKIWAGQLQVLWPDVKKGDFLSAELLVTGEVNFYHNQTYLGQISDVKFGTQFFDIWLSEKTTAPQLRQKLITQPVEK